MAKSKSKEKALPTSTLCRVCGVELKDKDNYTLLSSLSTSRTEEMFICGKGKHGKLFTCNHCGTTIYEGYCPVHKIYDSNSSQVETLCKHCYSKIKEDVFYCEYHNREEYGESVGISYGDVCQDAYDHNTFYCSNCDNTFIGTPEHDDGYCEDCHYESIDDLLDSFYSDIKEIGVKSKRNRYKNCLHKLTFGLEIETDEILKDSNKVFNKVCDGSIDGMEYVSPILKGDIGLNAVKNLLTKDLEAKVNDDCGLHLHIGGMEEKDIPKLMMAYKMLEPFFYKLVTKHRSSSGCGYCNVMDSKTENVETLDDVERILYGAKNDYNTDAHIRSNKSNHSGSDRYKWVNFHSFFFRKTLEIRLHHGSVDYEEIENWINLHGCFITWVMNSKPSEIMVRLDKIKIAQKESRKKLSKKKVREFIKLIAEVTNTRIANYYTGKLKKYWRIKINEVENTAPAIERNMEVQTMSI